MKYAINGKLNTLKVNEMLLHNVKCPLDVVDIKYIKTIMEFLKRIAFHANSEAMSIS